MLFYEVGINGEEILLFTPNEVLLHEINYEQVSTFIESKGWFEIAFRCSFLLLFCGKLGIFEYMLQLEGERVRRIKGY